MSTQNNLIGQKEQKQHCANHNSIIECDGWVGPEEGSQYCADCRTKVDVQCTRCPTIFSMPRGLYQILCKQKKTIQCYNCLHGGGDREAKPAAEHEPDNNPRPRRREHKEPRIVCCTLKRKDICARVEQPFNQMYRLDRKLSPGGLHVLVCGVVCEECANSIKSDFPGAIFREAGGRPLPHHHSLGHPHHPELTYKLLREATRPQHYLAA